jgi:hypothetical protein
VGEDRSLATAYAKVMHEIVDSEVLHNTYRQQIRGVLNGCQINCPKLEEQLVCIVVTVADIIAKKSIQHAEHLIDNVIEEAVSRVKEGLL